MLRSPSLKFTAYRKRSRAARFLPSVFCAGDAYLARGWHPYSAESQEDDKVKEESNNDSRTGEGIYPLSSAAKELLARSCSWAGIKPETWDVPSKTIENS